MQDIRLPAIVYSLFGRSIFFFFFFCLAKRFIRVVEWGRAKRGVLETLFLENLIFFLLRIIFAVHIPL